MKTRILTTLCLSLFAPPAFAQDAAATTHLQPAHQTGVTTSGDAPPTEARVPLW